jgi:nickel/cobalt exporter
MNAQHLRLMFTARRMRLMASLLALGLGLVGPVTAWAHPLGNFTINHYAGLSISRQAVNVDFVLDMAEIPAFQEIQTFDPDHTRQPDPAKAAGYHPATCEALRPDLDLRVNDRPLSLALVSSAVEFPPGAGGLLTLRLSCGFQAALAPAAAGTRLNFADHSYADRIGWREIVVNGDGVALDGNFASASLSRRLTAYPQDMLTSPLDQRQVLVGLASAGASSSVQVATPGGATVSAVASRSDGFTQLVTLNDLSLPALLAALLIAMVWGAMHAMTPGHGKTLVGAYLVGSRGTARHAVFLGLTTTVTHTAGVFALGLVTLFAAQFIVPDQLFPWLSFLSGLLVVAIGLNLFISRLKAARSPAAAAPGHAQPAHDHTGAHGHEDGHDHAGQAHDHGHDHAGYAHGHGHDHGPAGQAHVHDHAGQAHEHGHGHGHDHGPAGHTHLPPGADGAPVTWRSLLALGISGGLLPCPSALVVLLSAIALGRVGFGLVLVLAFSLGLAGTLTGIGLLLVYAGRLFERLPAQARWVRLVPAASALFITLAGAGITAQALVQIGLIRL